VNIVIQKGNQDNNGYFIMIGDMTIPPEKERMCIMIGLLNVLNVTVTVSEPGSKDDQSTLNEVMRLEVPDALFAPVVNLTSGKCGET
jgi:hypothetical protein